MTAYNVVRFRVKPGREQAFVDAHRNSNPAFAGMRKFTMVNTGPGTFCVIGEWDSFDALAAARPGMIGMLDNYRHMLEELGAGLGITDPVSGNAVLEMGPPAKRKAKKKAKKKAVKRAKPAKKKAPKKSAKRKKR